MELLDIKYSTYRKRRNKRCLTHGDYESWVVITWFVSVVFGTFMGKDRFNRDYLGKHWNRKYIRAVQAILNATKGKIGRGQSFFYRAFGNDESEFLNKLLYMPETYILYRFFFEDIGYAEKWWNSLISLNEEEKIEAKLIIEANDFSNISSLTKSTKIKKVLKHYTITRDDVSRNELKQYELNLKKNIL